LLLAISPGFPILVALQKKVIAHRFVSRGNPRSVAITVGGLQMAKKRNVRITQDEAVRLFAARLKEVRLSRGISQAELGRLSNVTASYIWRLESAGASPGIDLVARLAKALGTTSHDLLPATTPGDMTTVLRDQAREHLDDLLRRADRELILMVNQLLARLAGALR
jgi:transcriptional regulator with XRE-family HTH domain